MSSRSFSRVLAGVLASFVVAAGLASMAQADYVTVADWQFTDGSFLADSSGNGHTLTQTGAVGSTGGVATFDGTGTLGANIDLSGYNKLKVSWAMNIQTATFGVVYDSGYGVTTGAIAATAEETAGVGRVYMKNAWFDDKYTSTTSGLTAFSAEYDLTTAVLEDMIKVLPGGVTEFTAGIPNATFSNGVFNMGKTATGPGFIGQLDYLRIEGSPVPEPGAITLLASGLLGLLAYAWRKRK